MVQDETLLPSQFPLQHGLRDLLEQEGRPEKEGSRKREEEEEEKKRKGKGDAGFRYSLHRQSHEDFSEDKWARSLKAP